MHTLRNHPEWMLAQLVDTVAFVERVRPLAKEDSVLRTHIEQLEGRIELMKSILRMKLQGPSNLP